MDLSLGCLATKKVGWLRALRPTEVAAYDAICNAGLFMSAEYGFN